MKHRSFWMGVLALMLVLFVSIGAAQAYFTTYVTAQGGYVIRQGVHFEESFYDWTKHIVITSDEGTEPVYVRVRAYYSTSLSLQTSGDGWVQEGEWWYYTQPLTAGQSTAPLDMKILNIPDDASDGDDLNVVVVYEYAPVKYDADGLPLPYNSEEIWFDANPGGGDSP